MEANQTDRLAIGRKVARYEGRKEGRKEGKKERKKERKKEGRKGKMQQGHSNLVLIEILLVCSRSLTHLTYQVV